MIAFVRLLSRLSSWLDKRFPEKMTTADVTARFAEYETRLSLLERNTDVSTLRAEISKIKILHGLQQLTGAGLE